MRMFLSAIAVAAAMSAVPAVAQDMGAAPAAPADATTGQTATGQTGYDAPAPASASAEAPDGTRAFGIDPYVAVLGGWEEFDRRPGHGIPSIGPGADKLNGSLVQGIAGFNVPLGPVFVGVEGNAAKGVSGDIDWEYGAAGRFGFRAGESGLFYGKVGYQWVNFAKYGDNSRDFHAVSYGIGAEVGPKDIGLGGITGNAGVRFRVEVSTFGKADSFRPMAGAVFHF